MSEITAVVAASSASVLAARSASGALVCGGIRASSVATATTMSSRYASIDPSTKSCRRFSKLL